ncbi:MAG TPA: hypothetical protein VEI45_00050 [Mycobacterium sp.]|nr:hypothetical protein [Mycobacterium sp.]
MPVPRGHANRFGSTKTSAAAKPSGTKSSAGMLTSPESVNPEGGEIADQMAAKVTP